MKSTKTTINPLNHLSLEHECTGHSGPIYALDGDESFIYTASADKFVTRWNRETGKQDAFAIRCESSPFAIRLLNQKSIIAIGLSNGHLHIIDLQKRMELHLFTQHKAGIFALHADEARQHLFVGDADGFLSVWYTKSFQLKLIIPLCPSKIRAIHSMGDSRIAVANNDGEIIVLETEYMNEIHRFYAHEGGTSALYYDLSSGELLSGGKDGMLRWWKDLDFQIIRALPAHKGAIYGIQAIDAQHFVSISRDKSIKVWDNMTHKVIQKVEAKNHGHRHSVNAVWTDQRGTIATVGDDQLLRVFRWMSQM